MKVISIIFVFILVIGVALADNNQQKDLCDMQNKINEIVKRFTPKGQTVVKNLFLNLQNQFSNVLQKMYANIKSDNTDVLANLTAAEGDKIEKFWNAIGFNNNTVFSNQQLVDLCQLKTTVLSSLNALQPSSRATIVQLFIPALKDSKTDFQNIGTNFKPKAEAAFKELRKTEKMRNILALKNFLESFQKENF